MPTFEPYIMTSDESKIPVFSYFPDPIGNGCITRKRAKCPCCEKNRPFMYVGPIYVIEDIIEVCPWCVADGSAAAKWDASFNIIQGVPGTVPDAVVLEIQTRTPGFETWEENHWLYSGTDAMVFLGEVMGREVLDEDDTNKVDACLKALQALNWTPEESRKVLRAVTIAGQPAIYLFQDRHTGDYAAYAENA